MNTKHTLNYAEEPKLDDLFVVKKFNEWMAEARDEPVAKMLFGSLWLEGEMAVLTGDSGVGKSLLAVQIAESIASGKAFEPFAVTAKAQKVLYLNLKLSTKQFKARYAEEYDAEDGDTLKNCYKFHDNLKRCDIGIHGKLPGYYRSFDEVLAPLVERVVKKYKAKVVVIDNITLLQRSVYGYRETFAMMSALDELKRRLGISILVLARNARSGSNAALSCPTMFSRFADSVFMVGKSRLDPSARYIKQLLVHSSEMIYDESHVASFVLKRKDGNFLGFEHHGFHAESEHKKPVTDDRLWPMIDKVHTVSDDGKKSVREIAAELDIPKTSVHRYLQMWTPEIKAAVNPEPPTPPEARDTQREESFPGRREYDEALEDTRFDPVHDEDNEDIDRDSYEYRVLDHEAWLIEDAGVRANKIYKETGVAPKLADDTEYAEFKNILAAAGDPLAFDHIDRNTDEMVQDPDQSSDPDLDPDGGNADPVAKARISCKSSQAAWRSIAVSGETLPNLEYAINDHREEMWIEKRDKRRKPVVWYTFNSKGRKQQKVRDTFGVSTKTESGPLIE
jgi:AAA domain